MDDTNAVSVLVHCQHGADRTGTMCAMYRILREGWTADDAIDEMKNGGYGYHSVWGNLPRFIRKSAEQRVKANADGGQWGVPGLGLGVCGPSSGGPAPSERLLFPRRAGGAYLLNGTTTMVVSRGLARESTPLPRFFNHPELVVIDVKPR